MMHLLAIVAAISLYVLGPWFLTRGVFVPLGWPRAAWYGARMSFLIWPRDPAGGGLFSAAWALCCQREPAPEAIRWIRAQARADETVTAATLAALGLLAAARGDRLEARSFLEVVPLFDERNVDGVLRRHVHQWLVAEAASRGDWEGVLFHAQGAPYSARVAWAAGVARRLLDRADAPDDETLEALWARVPALHRHAGDLMARVRSDRVAPPSAPKPEGTPLEVALRCQVALLSGGGRAELIAAARAWEAALPTVDEALRDDLERDVEASLAQAAADLDVPLSDLGGEGLLAAAAAQVREDHLTTIELAAEALQTRLEAGRPLDPVDEAREWLALARVYQDGVDAGGDEVRRVVFRPVYQPLCTLSVQLYNDRGQRWLSNALTRWLLREARLAGDERAVALQERNLRV